MTPAYAHFSACFRLSRTPNNKKIPLRQAAIITCLQRASTERLQSISWRMPIIPLNEVLPSDSISRLVVPHEMLCEVVTFFIIASNAARKPFGGDVQAETSLLVQALWGEEKEWQRHVGADLGVITC